MPRPFACLSLCPDSGKGLAPFVGGGAQLARGKSDHRARGRALLLQQLVCHAPGGGCHGDSELRQRGEALEARIVEPLARELPGIVWPVAKRDENNAFGSCFRTADVLKVQPAAAPHAVEHRRPVIGGGADHSASGFDPAWDPESKPTAVVVAGRNKPRSTRGSESSRQAPQSAPFVPERTRRKSPDTGSTSGSMKNHPARPALVVDPSVMESPRALSTGAGHWP